MRFLKIEAPHINKKAILLFLIVSLFGTGTVFAVSYTQTTSGSNRVTGSSDRDTYDWGYKPIQISGRRENYVTSDCGWWYVIGTAPTATIKIYDAKNDLVFNTGYTTAKGQTGEKSYTWGTDDDPGRWKGQVVSTLTATFYFYVRGQLNVTDIEASSSPTRGQTVTINATLKDNAGNPINGSAKDNQGTSVVPTVTATIISQSIGGSSTIEITLYDDGSTTGDTIADDGVWTGQFIPTETGDHRIVISARDGHDKWVDGRGSTNISVAGTFPYAFFSGSIIHIILLLFLAYKLLQHYEHMPIKKVRGILKRT